MIVNKPQFDIENIKVGQAFYLVKNDHRRYVQYEGACLINVVLPLKISVVLFRKVLQHEVEKTLSYIDINIQDMVDGTFQLTPMEKVEEEKK